jgi:ABC-2 type transport system permease protein
VSAAQIRFFALLRREVNRFLKIKRQTLGAPLLETFLYISVFGAALGSRIDELEGIDYVVFIVPGLILMAWALNAFSNNSWSILSRSSSARSTTSSRRPPRRSSCSSPSPSVASCGG